MKSNNEKTNRPAGTIGGAAATKDGQKFQYDFRHCNMQEWVNTTPGVFRPYFLDYCTDSRAIYLEEPAARRVMNQEYQHVVFNLAKWEGLVYFISADDLAREGSFVSDKVGDLLWRVPRGACTAVRI